MKSSRMIGSIILCVILLMSYATSSISPTAEAQTRPAVNNSQSKPGLASTRDLAGDGSEIACGTRDLACASTFSARQWTNWLINCPYRDPTRIGNPKFNFSDLTYLHRRYGNAFAAYVNPAFTFFAQHYDGRIRVWIYRGAKPHYQGTLQDAAAAELCREEGRHCRDGDLGTDNLEDEWGVSDRVIYANKLPASVGGNGPVLLPCVRGAVRIQPCPEDVPLQLPQVENPITLLINQHNPVEVDAAIIVSNAFIRMHGRLDGRANAKEYMAYMVASQKIADEPRLINEKDR